MTNIVKATKYEAQDMNRELGFQNKQIDILGTNIDRVDANMIRVDSSMKKLLKSSNHVWLWVILIIELLVMIIILAS